MITLVTSILNNLHHIHQNQIKKAAEIIKNAKKPLLYVGGGVIMSEGINELRIFAKENNLFKEVLK